MKTIGFVLLFLAIGLVLGAALGFGVPFGIAQIRPDQAQALSFMPIISLPAGAVLGGIIGAVVGARKGRSA